MILLDTHTWFWANNEEERLSEAARDVIEESDWFGISPMSCWELGMLAGKGRIEFEEGVRTWIRRALANPRLTLIPLEADAALEAALLDAEIGKDPADRIIYSTARSRGLRLVTRDQRLRDYDPRGTLW